MKNKLSNERWQKMKKLGKHFFIIKYGVLGWGLSTGVLGSFFIQLIHHKFNFSILFTSQFYIHMSSLTLMTLSFGWFWGLFLWKLMKKKYDDN